VIKENARAKFRAIFSFDKSFLPKTIPKFPAKVYIFEESAKEYKPYDPIFF